MTRRTYPWLNEDGLNAVRREAEREGLKVTQTNGKMVIEGDDQSVQRASHKLRYNYDNGDGAGIVSKEEYPYAFW